MQEYPIVQEYEDIVHGQKVIVKRYASKIKEAPINVRYKVEIDGELTLDLLPE